MTRERALRGGCVRVLLLLPARDHIRVPERAEQGARQLTANGMSFMRIRFLVMATFAAGALAAPLRAQDTATKPGGLNKVAHNVSKTAKKAGKDTKAEVHRDAAKAHKTLTKAGNETKAELKRTTGVTVKSPDAEHKPGGLNKVARDVSHTSKKAGAKAKHGIKKVASEAHGALSTAGKNAKQEIKDSTKKP